MAKCLNGTALLTRFTRPLHVPRLAWLSGLAKHAPIFGARLGANCTPSHNLTLVP